MQNQVNWRRLASETLMMTSLSVQHYTDNNNLHTSNWIPFYYAVHPSVLASTHILGQARSAVIVEESGISSVLTKVRRGRQSTSCFVDGLHVTLSCDRVQKVVKSTEIFNQNWVVAD